MADGYTVLDQKQQAGLLPTGDYGQVVRVTFRTTGGAIMSVDIPVTDYNVDNVRAAIEQRVGHAEEVSNL